MASTRKRNVEVQFLVDDKQATKSLKNIEGSIRGTAKSFSTAAKVIGGFAIGSVISNAARESIEAFSSLEQSVGGTEAVFGDASDSIDEFAKTSAFSIGLAESEFRTATTTIGGQLKRMTGDVEFAADKSVLLTQTAADLAATYGGTTAEAVTALGAAFRGEADPAERFNLNLKASVVNAKAVELGLAEATSSVDENAKAQAILALIAEQSADAQGQFGREADTVAGKTQRLTAQLEDQQALLGERLAPAYVAGTERLSEMTVGFSDLFGLIDAGEAQLMKLASQMGVGSDTAEAFATAVKLVQNDMTDFWGVQLDSTKGMELWRKEMGLLIGAAGLGEDQLRRLVDGGLDYFMGTLGLTEEQAQFLVDALNLELAKALTDTEKNLRDGRMTWQEYQGSIDDTTTAVDDFISAQLAAADPVLAAVRASQQAEDAQRKMNAAIMEYGDQSPEAIAATLGFFDAMVKADAAANKWADEGGPEAIQAFENAAREAQISEDVISAVVAALERLNDLGVLPNPFTNYPKGTPFIPDDLPNPDFPGFAHGGVVPGPVGAAMPAIVHGGELVLNPEQQKAVFGNGSAKATTVVNQTFVDVGVTTLAELQELYARQ